MILLLYDKEYFMIQYDTSFYNFSNFSFKQQQINKQTATTSLSHIC